ncbi:MAG TPA: GGDEF domain-containing protein [Clostridia bacterium]|nr:GGDEF domain-containing protein [Clostridia bacterium]HOT70559.1 GGDEF domain-containing protein [Clostridia bacterium]HQG00150.1 GGDEF domain-containing protein [Clostridia bacterium]HQH66273.1 GGDEF domain-containing protein [Clostridia bacterium]HQJ92123.1 GGDEF domain-containing protein [Clostridia bacterium]
MINYPAIYIANGAAVMLLSLILLSSKRPSITRLFDERLFYGMVIFNIIQCCIETVVFILDGNMAYGSHTLLIVLNAALYINDIIFAFLWVIYADYKLFGDMRRIRRIYPYVGIPAILVLICCIINFVTPVFFTINEYNVYQRTGLYIIPFAVTYFYMAYGVLLIYLNRNKVQKYLFMPAILFMIPIIIGSLLQFFFYGYSLIWLGVAIGLVSLFLNIQNEAAYIDALSGLFNRHYLDSLFLMCLRREDASGVLAGIMLDIDGFKKVNDEFGHTVGDDAISEVGRLLYTAVGDKGVSCRYGGDEFIILMHAKSEKEIIDMVNTIKAHTREFNESSNKPYKIHFSIGYSTYDNEHESTDDFLRKLDTSMYEDKKRNIAERVIPDRRRTT